MRLLHWLLFAASALLLFGCGLFQQLEVQSLGTAARKPSNVGVYLSVADGLEPLTELGPENFRIYETSSCSTRTRRVRRCSSARSPRSTTPAPGRPERREGRERAPTDLERHGRLRSGVSKTQGVSVYASTGGEHRAHRRLPQGGSVPDELPALTSFKTADPSRNLHGAVVAA